jgi:large subunit ribosomal protein L10
MPTQKKMDQVEELKQKFTESTIVVATDYTGLSVNAMTDLRRKMRESNVEYRVVKNTLTYLAADAAGRPQIKDIVQGPTCLAVGYEDPINVARALEEYIRVNRSPLAIKGAVLEGRTLTSDQVTALPKIPPKEQLVAQLLGQFQSPLITFMGQLQSPLYRLLGTLNGPLASLAILLQQRAEQLKAQEAAS